MGTQVLMGSKGRYKLPNASPHLLGETEFIVTADTCMEAEFLPVKFKDAAESCRIPLKHTTFTMDAKYKDY